MLLWCTGKYLYGHVSCTLCKIDDHYNTVNGQQMSLFKVTADAPVKSYIIGMLLFFIYSRPIVNLYKRRKSTTPWKFSVHFGAKFFCVKLHFF